MKKYKIGYTQGTYDLFHVGHLNLLMHAKEQCDFLIVGVNSNKLVEEYKNKKTIIDEQDRARIVSAIKCVDQVYITNTLDKNKIAKDIKFDAIFIGDDWKNNERWIKTKEEMKEKNIDVVFLPHTDGISSTIIRQNMGEK